MHYMNKTEWDALTHEERVQWWGENAPHGAQFKTESYFRKLEGGQEYFFNHLGKWEVTRRVRPLSSEQWKVHPGFVCEKPTRLKFIPKVGEECEAVDYACGNDEYYKKVIFIGDNPKDKSEGSFKAFSCADSGDLFWSDKFRPIITERDTRAIQLYKMFHSDCLSDREIVQSDKFDTYLNMWDALVKIQQGDV